MNVKPKRSFVLRLSDFHLRKILVFVTCLLLTSVTNSYAQQKSISGKVVDETNEPLIGVSVVIQGTSTGVITDFDGHYIIAAQSGNVLEFSYIGMTSQTVTVGRESTINVVLKDNATMLAETVVIGYGTAKAKDLASSITTVRADDLMKTPSGQIMSSVQGKVAGLQIISSGGPGKAPTVRLRGIGSYPHSETATNDAPLYVVDGIFYDNIDFLNTADIATISVLKDASASAIYGVRAANGVVLIETKSGGYEKKTEVTFDGYVGVQRAQNILKMANAEQFTAMAMESGFSTDRTNVEKAMQRYGRSRVNPNVPDVNTDWYQEILRLAPIQNYSVDVSGGSSNASYSIGGSYFTQQGILDMKNDYDRFNLRTKLDFKATKWLTIGGNVIWSQATQHPEEAGAWNQAYFAVPILPLYDELNEAATGTKYANAKDLGYRSGQNPLPTLNYADKKHLIRKLLTSFYLKLDLVPKTLSFKTSYNNASTNLDERDVLLPYNLGNDFQRRNASLTKKMINYSDIAWDNILTYTAATGENHSLTVMLGSSFRTNTNQSLEAEGLDFPAGHEESWYIDQASEISADKVKGGGFKQYGMSYFGRVSYNFKQKYLIYGTMRADGSSKYQEKWGYFPSVGIGWIVSDEGFMKDIQGLDFLKIRAGWGQLGNENIPASDGSLKTEIVYTSINGVRVPGTKVSGVYSSLKWELTEETNIGISSKLLDNKLSVEADYYIRDTKNAAIKVKIPAVGGDVMKNVGVIRNQGFELALNWDDKISKDFTYNIGVNLSTLKNVVRDLYGQPYIDGGTEEFRQRSMVGQSLLAFYGYKVAGVYQNQSEIDADPIAVANGLIPGD
ncbi:MAG: SusC/RagA family TonB-linked outer membrane protein, partial [Mediterranea sp.]|nr:SusC/RagA family TonB-linked outer membrane protein [Mediterranea sp.]